jgi:hypothetical protein
MEGNYAQNPVFGEMGILRRFTRNTGSTQFQCLTEAVSIPWVAELNQA